MAVVLEATDLYRFYHAGDDETLALRGVSLQVSTGDFVAVVGPSGSGKSTLLACLAGFDEPDGGSVRIDGRQVTRRPHAEQAAMRARFVGFVFQGQNLVGHLDVETNLRAVQALAKQSRGTAGWRRSLLDELGIAHRARAYPSQLSGGEAVRAGLAVALVNDPPVVLADEPTSEIDGEAEQRVLALFRRQAAAGRAVVVATHSEAVADAATRVVTLADGVVVA
ncbi:MAG: putative transport system ATP-binding protein [Actinomycetota bacterium]|jgi:putative ABC transport system ATP-binding protein|nr:putative transport system ATP-binding protein [Actinomycetota bacterium]